jgi:hypothetical protein
LLQRAFERKIPSGRLIRVGALYSGETYVTEKVYYKEYRELGFGPTEDFTILTERWENRFGETIYITKASELSPEDRAAAVDYIKKTLGVNFPIYPRAH